MGLSNKNIFKKLFYLILFEEPLENITKNQNKRKYF
jgi:hypothetical protein